jgi:hypothetical protein
MKQTASRFPDTIEYSMFGQASGIAVVHNRIYVNSPTTRPVNVRCGFFFWGIFFSSVTHIHFRVCTSSSSRGILAEEVNTHSHITYISVKQVLVYQDKSTCFTGTKVHILTPAEYFPALACLYLYVGTRNKNYLKEVLLYQ